LSNSLFLTINNERIWRKLKPEMNIDLSTRFLPKFFNIDEAYSLY
jgi:hypothetical protein